MKTNIKNRKKQLLALSLSLLMVSSVAALAGCNDDSTSSSSSSSSSSAASAKTNSLITNASFETFDTNNGKNLISKTVSGWTRATISNLTSNTASGVISTSDDRWKDLTTSIFEDDYDYSTLSTTDAKAKWSTMTAKDKILFMEAWEDANPDDDIEDELDFITSYNVDSEDLPTCENPGVATESATDDNVLMIHNAYDWNNYKELGTAQKFTSSSTVTVPAGTAAKFSVWVKTSDLKTSTSAGEVQDAVDKGAFISVTHSVGNKSMDALQINNINTNDWTQYTFYLNGTSYADTTFTLVLGLGQGSSDDRWGHVSGYAFFDEIECELITRNDFDEATDTSVPSFGFEDDADAKKVDAFVSNDKTFALNYYGEFTAIKNDEQTYLDTVTSFDVTTETSKHNHVYTAATVEEGTIIDGKNVSTYTGLGLSQTDKVTHVFKNAAEMTTHADYKNNQLLQQVYKDYFEGKDFLKNENKNEQILMLMSPSGAAYTAKSGYEFSVNAGERLAISFFVKTSDLNDVTGATVTLHQGNSTYALSNLDVSDITAVDVNDDNKDIYTGWQQCLFYVKNSTEDTKTFTLSFSFGPTTVIGNTLSSYYTGFAAFAGFESYAMEEAEFASAQSGTYATIVTLQDDSDSSSTNGFDTTATVPTNAIENGYANLRNYKGVYTDSIYLGGTEKEVNANETAGLLNKNYAENYTEILTKLGASNAADDAAAAWNNVFGNATQPLVIYNEGEQTNAYGFIGSVQTISASTYKTVSLRMKVSAGAKANVYLIDMDNLDKEKGTFNSTLSIGSKIVYWYDDDGNVCAADPSDHDFNEKTDVALKLQSNGLYMVNPRWTGYDASYEGKYYANLANYDKNANGDLIVAEGGVSYDYNDKWENEGNDGIAYYCKDGAYYADKACTILVSDFSAINVPARYEAQAAKDLAFEVGSTNGEWVTVTFYIHTGNVEKNYRLEIWSGARDNSVVNGTGSYVIVDSNTPDDLDADSFSENIEDRKEEEGLNGVTIDSFESVFSFYDNAKFLRYNETIDENNVTNSYDDYLSSSKTASTAYLKYTSDNVLELYADYALSEDTVSPDADDDDSSSDSSDDTTEADAADLWLLGSSIIIAAVLLFAVISLIVRKAMHNARKRKGIVVPKKQKKEKKVKQKAEEKSEEKSDEAQN